MQAQVAIGGKVERILGEIADLFVWAGGRRLFDQIVAREQIGDTRHRFEPRIHALRSDIDGAIQFRLQQPMRVIERRPQHLSARQVLECGRDAPAYGHRAGVDRLAGAEPRQGGAERAEQKDGLDEIAARLLDRQRRKLAIVKRAFVHHSVDCERELLFDLRERQLRNGPVSAPHFRKQSVRVLDGALAALGRYVHGCVSRAMSRTERGNAATVSADTSSRSTPRGNSARLSASRSTISCGSGVARSIC